MNTGGSGGSNGTGQEPPRLGTSFSDPSRTSQPGAAASQTSSGSPLGANRVNGTTQSGTQSTLGTSRPPEATNPWLMLKLDDLQRSQGKIEQQVALLHQKLDQQPRTTGTVSPETHAKLIRDLELRERQTVEFQNKERQLQEKLHDAEYKERQANSNAEKLEKDYFLGLEEREQLTKRLRELQAANAKLTVDLAGRPTASFPEESFRKALLQWALDRAKRRAPNAVSPELQAVGARIKTLHLRALAALGVVKEPPAAREAVANLKRALDEARGLLQEVEAPQHLPLPQPTLSFQVVTGPVEGAPEPLPHYALQVEASYTDLIPWADSWIADRSEQAEALFGKVPYIQDLMIEAYRECFAGGLTDPGSPAEPALRELLEVNGLKPVVPQTNKRFDVHDHEYERDDFDSPLAPGYITVVVAPGFQATDGSYIRKPRVAVSARR